MGPNRLRRPVTLTLSVEARAALEKLAEGPPKEDMSRVVERLLLASVLKPPSAVWDHKDGTPHSASGPLGCPPCSDARRMAKP